jgi:hypothetical protein
LIRTPGVRVFDPRRLGIGSGGGCSDLGSYCGGEQIQRVTAAAARGRAHWACPRLSFFVFYLIYPGKYLNRLRKDRFIETFEPRRL